MLLRVVAVCDCAVYVLELSYLVFDACQLVAKAPGIWKKVASEHFKLKLSTDVVYFSAKHAVELFLRDER